MATTKKDTSEKEPEAKIVKVEWTKKEQGNEEIRKGRIEKEYKVPANELNHVHAELEQVQMNTDFEKTSKPTVQKFDLRAWDNFRKNVIQLGYNHCKVLYAPEGTNIETSKTLKKVKAEKEIVVK